MPLDKSDIEFLTRVINNCERYLKDPKVEGAFRIVARSEAARLQLNMDGWRWDVERGRAYKVTQNEKREYFDASTTNSTSK